MHRVSANGASIAAIGRSTWILKGDACPELVSGALAFGYRHAGAGSVAVFDFGSSGDENGRHLDLAEQALTVVRF